MASAAFTVLLCTAFTAYSSASIDIYCGTQLSNINQYLFGSGDEIDEEFIPLEELVTMIDQTGVTMLRMGGIANEYYDWEGNGYNGVRYIDLVDTLILQQNVETTIDDFLEMCEQNQIEPILSVNFQLNDPAKAARFVEYCNGDQTTPMGQIRAQRGHPEPYNVEYWEIGNEPDISGAPISAGGYTLTLYRHFGIPFDQWHWTDSTFATPETYALLANTYSDAMRAASPVPLQIATISLSGNILWLQETLETCEDNTDWVDIHYYPSGTWEQTPPDTSDYITWLTSLDTGPNAFDEWYQTMCTLVDIYSGGADIPVCIMEYNAIVVNSDPTWWNYIDGLFVADCLGHMAEKGCPMGGCYSIFEGSETDPYTAFGMIRGDTLSYRNTAWVLKLFQNNLSGTMVNAVSDAVGGGYGLEVHASLREDGKLCLMVVNKHLTDDFQTNITLHGYSSSGYAELIDITNDAPMEAPWNGTTGIQYKGGIWGTPETFSYTFPRASVTCLLVHPEGSGVEQEEGSFFNLCINPVPATGILNIQFTLQEESPVKLLLFDSAGRAVKTVLESVCLPGSHALELNTESFPSGTYLLQAQTGAEMSVRKLVIR